MIDAGYVVATVAFFAAMLAYVAGCDRLRRSADSAAGNEREEP
ncbi:MAG TPA: hypothetical protein VFT41_09635 [Gemmatimonadaceae bacterium]|nr:hypothetical protein [Gemmatimonadaceae bacterium]